MHTLGTLAIILVVAVAACATTSNHAATRASVVMRLNATDAHVGLGSTEVRVGDRVNLIHHDCPNSWPTEEWTVEPPSCTARVVGSGQVVQVLSDHYSVVRFPSGMQFVEGDTIEKAR